MSPSPSTVPPTAQQLVREHLLAMQGYTPGEQVNDCLKLNTNECAWPPSPQVLAALAALDPDQLRRYPDPQSQALRQCAESLWGHPADGIVAGNGSDDCLTMIYRAVLRPGSPAANDADTVAVPWPTYGLYDTLASIQGVRMLHIPWAAGWGLPSEALLAAQPRLVLIANPNNPSGTLIPVDQLRQLASQLNGLLVVDEAYIDYAPEGSSCIPFLDQHPNMVVLRTCSKSYSLAGARLGFCLGQPEFIAQLAKIKDSYNVNSMTQIAGLAALNDSAHHKQLLRDTLAARDQLAAGIAALGWSMAPSSGNFLLCHAGPRAGEWYRALKQRGILVRWWDNDLLRQQLRITVGQEADNRRLLAALGELTA